MHAVKVVIIVICMTFPFFCMGREAVELKQTPKNHKIISLCLKDDIDLGGNVILGEVFWTIENKSDTVINIPADNLGNDLYRVNYPDFVISAIDSEGHEWGMMAGFFRRAYDFFKLKPHRKMTFVSEIFLICDFYSIKGNGLNEKDFYIKMSGNLILSKSGKIEIFRDIKAQPKRCP